MKVIDYSRSRPNLDAVKAMGFAGVMRYLSWLPNAKCLIDVREDGSYNLAERDAILTRGLALGLNWEYQAEDVMKTDGISHAKEALRQARRLDYPNECAIYYSGGDINIRPDYGAKQLLTYMSNVKRVHAGEYRIGLYGGKYSLTLAFDTGLIDVGWQACAPWGWYNNGPRYPGNKYDRASAWQYNNGVTIGGQEVDISDINPAHPLHLWTPSGKDEAMQQMLVRFSDSSEPNQIWLCDGQFRRRVKPEWVGADGKGPITNEHVHMASYLGNLGRGGQVFAATGDPDVWGVDIATLQSDSGGGGDWQSDMVAAVKQAFREGSQ